MARKICLVVAYDGTDFHGWQFQTGQRTVQGVMEDALRRVVRHEASLVGSGRTDAGVHAAGHVSHFVTTSSLPVDRLRDALNARLSPDVAVLSAREVHERFHARRDAVSKLYRYRVHHSRHRPVAHCNQRYVYHCWKSLSLGRMREAARHFVGEQDFAAMASKSALRESTVRTVLRCDVERHLDEIRIDVEGTGFLYKQVRTMAGTLLNVGRGLWGPDHVRTILDGGDRGEAGTALPGAGLCLRWVRYPPRLMRPAVVDSEDAAAIPVS